MNRKFVLGQLLICAMLVGCSSPQKDSQVKAIYDTRLEAEQAAKEFNCIGAHQMGNKWMPCEKHSDHMNHHKH